MRRALMLVSDRRRLPAGRTLADLATEAARAGVEMFQVREKDLGARALLDVARDVVAAAAGSAMRVLVNARPDVARFAGADGVHLPEQGLPAAEVRRLFPGLAVGVSCHSLDSARRAAEQGAEYVVLGPVFATAGKERPLGLAAVAEAARAVAVPVIAIGGIGPGNVAAVWRAGASGVAGIGAFHAAAVAEAARLLRDGDAREA